MRRHGPAVGVQGSNAKALALRIRGFVATLDRGQQFIGVNLFASARRRLASVLKVACVPMRSLPGPSCQGRLAIGLSLVAASSARASGAPRTAQASMKTQTRCFM
jgi:hypothetical protein